MKEHNVRYSIAEARDYNASILWILDRQKGRKPATRVKTHMRLMRWFYDMPKKGGTGNG